MHRYASQLAVLLLVYALALLLGEMQTRKEADSTWYCHAVIWLIFVGIDIWYLYA